MTIRERIRSLVWTCERCGHPMPLTHKLTHLDDGCFDSSWGYVLPDKYRKAS